MNIRTGIILIILAVLVAVGGWYIYAHTQNLPHVLNENGDRQVKDESDYYSVQVVYPNTTRLGTRTDSSAGADKRATDAMESWVNQTVSSFKSDANQALTADEKARLSQSGIKYSLNISYRSYNSGSFVSEEFDISQDTAGAHPINLYKTFVFDLKGNQVNLSDLFTSNEYLNRIAAEAKSQVTQQLTARAGKEASSTLVADGVAPKAENFADWVDDNGTLRVFIPPYQAAAYAAGSFEVRIPLDSLKDILKPNIQ